MQRTQFCAKNVKNDLKPMDFLKRNFYFETEGVLIRDLPLTTLQSLLFVG
jgi:hypothetical protein